MGLWGGVVGWNCMLKFCYEIVWCGFVMKSFGGTWNG